MRPAWTKICEIPSQPTAGCSGAYLSSKLQGRLRLEGSWFQVSLSKKVGESHFRIKKLDMVVSTYHPNHSCKYRYSVKIGGLLSRLVCAKSETLSEK
jgi:hypothetical protein